MDRQTKLTVIIAVASVGTLLISFLTGLPVIIDRYPEFLAGVISGLPMDAISVWSERVGLLLLGITLGWYARGRVEADSTTSVNTIEACVEKGGVAWKGTAELSNGKLVNIDIPYKPICPKCQSFPKEKTVRYNTNSGPYDRRSQPKSQDYWKCPNSDCQHSKKSEYDYFKEAENLLESHFERIIESEGEEYSLDALVEAIDGEPTPKEIWRQYVEVVDDSDVSTNCFH